MAGKTIIVTGSKGGVGTTTVALNIGVQLAARSKKRTALVDLARPFGQISLMLDLNPRFTVLDALERIDRLDEALFCLSPSPPPWPWACSSGTSQPPRPLGSIATALKSS